MSDDTSPANDAGTIDADTVEQAVQTFANSRKTRTYELPNPEGDEPLVLEFEYRMLSEEEREEISKKASSMKPTRSGQEDDIDVDISLANLLHIKKGVTDTNIEGFTLSDRGIKKYTTPDIREDLADSISDYASMPESDRRKFH